MSDPNANQSGGSSLPIIIVVLIIIAGAAYFLLAGGDGDGTVTEEPAIVEGDAATGDGEVEPEVETESN